jgi:hypothetical protein
MRRANFRNYTGEFGSIKSKQLTVFFLNSYFTLNYSSTCFQLLEERDTLQLKLSNVLRHNVSLHEEVNLGKEPPTGEIPSYNTEALKMKLAELEHMKYTMEIDLRREREARRLVQEQLFFSSSSRSYPANNSANRQSHSPSRTTPTPSPSPPSPGQGSYPSIPVIPYQQPHPPVTPNQQIQPPQFQSTPQNQQPQFPPQVQRMSDFVFLIQSWKIVM